MPLEGHSERLAQYAILRHVLSCLVCASLRAREHPLVAEIRQEDQWIS